MCREKKTSAVSKVYTVDTNYTISIALIINNFCENLYVRVVKDVCLFSSDFLYSSFLILYASFWSCVKMAKSYKVLLYNLESACLLCTVY